MDEYVECPVCRRMVYRGIVIEGICLNCSNLMPKPDYIDYGIDGIIRFDDWN